MKLAREKPRYGYRRLQVLIEREGERVNHKRLYRVYRDAGLCLKRKKRKHCARSGSPRIALTAANQEWAIGGGPGESDDAALDFVTALEHNKVEGPGEFANTFEILRAGPMAQGKLAVAHVPAINLRNGLPTLQNDGDFYDVMACGCSRGACAGESRTLTSA